MSAEEEKTEEQNEAPEETLDSPEEQEEGKTGVSAGAEGANETDEDTGEADQIEEEVVLDEAGPGEEKPPEPGTPGPEEETAKETAREEKAGSGKQAIEKGHGKERVRGLLRKRWLLLSGGVFFLALAVSFVFLGGNGGKTLNLESFLGGQGKEDQSFVQTVLEPFFIPLPEDSENAAIRLVISAKWDPETLSRYKRRSAVIRNEVYRYLVQAAGSGRDMVKQKSALAAELNQVFRHALAVKKIDVRVDEVSVI